MAKFIHTSDWHLGSPFSRFSKEVRQKLNKARLIAVEGIFIYAQKRGIKVILNAGDTIDNGRMAETADLLELFAIIKGYPGIRLVMIAGNHDPLMPNSVYRRVMKESFPDNLTLVEGGRAIIPIAEQGMTIYAASILEKNGNYNPLGWLQTEPADNQTIAIGLAHGSIRLGDQRFGEDAFPIEAGFAEAVKLDYLALGDWHSFKKINTRTFYCGTHEPRGFEDQGYALEVEITGAGAVPDVHPIQGISQYRWQQQTTEITDDSLSDFKQILERTADREIIEIAVSGNLSAAKYREYKEFLEMVRVGKPLLFLKDRITLAPTDEELTGMGDGPVREVVEQLLALKESADLLPEHIMNGLLPGDQLHLEDELQVSKEEVINRALLKLYRHYSTEKQE